MATTNKKKEEKIRTAFWKRQAYILKSKLGKCRDCSNNTQKEELDAYFFKGGGSDCGECDDEENKKYCDFIKEYGNN